jgi:hypothetical protein
LLPLTDALHGPQSRSGDPAEPPEPEKRYAPVTALDNDENVSRQWSVVPLSVAVSRPLAPAAPTGAEISAPVVKVAAYDSVTPALPDVGAAGVDGGLTDPEKWDACEACDACELCEEWA